MLSRGRILGALLILFFLTTTFFYSGLNGESLTAAAIQQKAGEVREKVKAGIAKDLIQNVEASSTTAAVDAHATEASLPLTESTESQKETEDESTAPKEPQTQSRPILGEPKESDVGDSKEPPAPASVSPVAIDEDESATVARLEAIRLEAQRQEEEAAATIEAAKEAERLANMTPEEREKAIKEKEEQERKEKKEREEKEKKEREKAEQIHRDAMIKLHEHKRDETIKAMSKDKAMQEKFKVTAEDIGIVIRTGNQVEGRLAGPLSTWAINRTTENLILYSDLESSYGPWRVQDAIQPWVDRPAITKTDAAKYWRNMYEKAKDGKTKEKREFNGWQLDALKFVSAVQLGYTELRQHREFKWYVFADDDTYYHLPTLTKLLSNLDYEDEFYLGGVSYFGIAFAHGGAGAVASAGAMKKRFIDEEAGVLAFIDKGATAQYGDTNLAQAFADVDIYFDHSFQNSFNGEQPFTKPMFHDTICQSVVTWHHLPLAFFAPFHEKVKDLAELTYIQVIAALSDLDKVLTGLWYRKDWTFNMDPRDVGDAGEAKDLRNNHMVYIIDERHRDQLNPRRCQAMCTDNERCISWTYIPDERACYLADWFRSGHERVGSVSGVDPIRLSQWQEKCKPAWPKKFD